MADEKRNALFSKLFGKEKKSEQADKKNENAIIDDLMNEEDPEYNEVPPVSDNDQYADWFADMPDDSSADGDAFSDTIEELFGSDDIDEIMPDYLPEYDDESVSSMESEQTEVPEDVQNIEEHEFEQTEYLSADGGDYIFDEDAAADYDEEFSLDTEESVEESNDETDDSEHSAIDEDTATLLTALGYSGADTEKIKRPSVHAESSRHRVSDLTLAYGYDGNEYTSHSQTAAVKAAYSRNRNQLFVRLFGTLLFVILLAIYDVFGKKFGGALDISVYPVINILMSLQLLLIAAAFSIKQIWAGINGIIKSEPIFHSLSAAAVLLTVVYDIILAIVAPEAFTLYNFPAGVCLIFGIAHDFFTLEREIYVFDRLSSWQSVATLERVDPAELASELGEDPRKGGQAFRLKRGEFAENYFRHINRPHPFSKIVSFLLIVPVLTLSIVLAIITAASDHSFAEAMNAFMVVNLIGIPASMLISMSYPFFTLVAKKLNAECIIFSESDVGEYKKVDTVVFEEADLFDESSLSISRISVCDKSRVDDVFDIMCGVSALYDRIGGRIAGAFKASTGESDAPEDVRVIRVDDGGFEGIADGKHYTVGSDAYLSARGIPVMRYYDDKFIASNPGGVVLHIAVDDVEVFKLYLVYKIPDNMLLVLGELPGANTDIVIRTIDPNINLDLILRLLSNSFNGRLTLVRKQYSGANSGAPAKAASFEGGVLVNGDSPEAIIDVVKGCSHFASFSKMNFNLSLILYGVGVLLSVILGFIGALVGLPSMYIFLFQALSAIPCFALVNIMLNK